ncbi:eukaryotic translation initiation factor 3 subunit j [Carabus blaptoides fortunei]
MEEEWDTDNFTLTELVAVSVNKWEGEDEDDDVKDSWDVEEEEEKKDVEKIEQKTKQKPKKSLADKIAEKERLKQEEFERKMKEKEEEMTPEEKIRQEKESDLLVALETTFGDSGSGIDGMNPTTKEEFTELAEALNKKMIILAKNIEFPTFAEDHIRNICASLSSADIKKLKTTIDNMYIEKQKAEKGDKAKKNKGKGKAKLRLEGDNTFQTEYSTYGDYDYDDFM